MTTFGDLITDGGDEAGFEWEEGEYYPALILKAALPRDPETGEFLKFKKRPGEKGEPKSICDVTFAVNGDEDLAYKRRYGVTVLQGPQGWPAFAQLITAACGIPCGDSRQKQLGTKDIEGQWVRVSFVRVEKEGGKQYVNIDKVLAPKKAAKTEPDDSIPF